MKTRSAAVLGLSLALTLLFSPTASARENRGGRAAQTSNRRGATLRDDHRIAVQPFEGGANAGPLRALVSRIVRGHGFRPVTTLPHYEGTGQYPNLAREHHLTAFVTAGVEQRGPWSSVTFLVWSGANGSIVRRWTASAPSGRLNEVVGRGFWSHLGPAVQRTVAPPLPPEMEQAPTMRIDASETRDEPLAAR
ncbi:MAG TPA: hypothetical protein VIU64_07880 [Polyangia bacterium]